MSTNRFLSLIDGVQSWFTAITTSSGIGDASKIVATGTEGRLSSSLLPSDTAFVNDITGTQRYGKFTGLKSNYYLLGADLGITPVTAGQSGISSYWGLQLGGLRGDLLYTTAFVPIDPPALTNKETVGNFCVAVFPGNTNLANSYPTTFNTLAIYRATWQIGGNFLACKNASNTTIFNIDLSGNIVINGNKILGSRETGWTPATGTALRGAFNTETATNLENARRIKAIEDLLRTHGLMN
jgi:hypothetical protein